MNLATLRKEIERDEGIKYEIYYDSYHYEYDSKAIKRGIFYLKVKKSL